jgi:hypothetical protein
LAEERSLEHVCCRDKPESVDRLRSEWKAAYRNLRRQIVELDLQHQGRHPGFAPPVALLFSAEPPENAAAPVLSRERRMKLRRFQLRVRHSRTNTPAARQPLGTTSAAA